MKRRCRHLKVTLVQRTLSPSRHIYPIEQCQTCAKLRYIGHLNPRWRKPSVWTGYDEASGCYLAP